MSYKQLQLQVVIVMYNLNRYDSFVIEIVLNPEAIDQYAISYRAPGDM